MISLIALLAVLGLGVVGWMTGRARARLFYTGRGSAQALPVYHAWHLALWAAVPAVIVWLVWQSVWPGLALDAAVSGPVGAKMPDADLARGSLISEAWMLVNNPDAGTFNPLAPELAAALGEAKTQFEWIGAALTLIAGFAGAAWGYTRVNAAYPARTRVEEGIRKPDLAERHMHASPHQGRRDRLAQTTDDRVILRRDDHPAAL